jgi:hypothetical protein
MKLEFVGGSRDGGTFEVPSKLIPTSPLFDGPVYLTPVSQLIHKAVNGVKVDRPKEYFEVYAQIELGKLLFIGWQKKNED